MAMRQNGLAKLSEEAGELIQVVGKLIQYPELQTEQSRLELHPDGTFLRVRLVEELADLVAAINFVTTKLDLDTNYMSERQRIKLALFQKWDSEP